MHGIDTASEMPICLLSDCMRFFFVTLAVPRSAGVQRRQSSRRVFYTSVIRKSV